MTLSTTTNRVLYQTDGINRYWPYTWDILSPDDLKLFITDLGGVTTQVTSNLSVDVQNKRIIYPTVVSGISPLSGGYTITVERLVPIVQPLDLTNEGVADLSVIEHELDRITMIEQQLQDQLSRAVMFPVSTNPTPDQLDASKFVGAGGNNLQPNLFFGSPVSGIGPASYRHISTADLPSAISSVLTGYTAGAGTVSAADTILQALQKLDGNISLKANIANPTFTGTVTAPLFSGNVSGTASAFTGNLTGDVTSIAMGTIISPNVVLNSKLARMPGHSFKGNNTPFIADAMDLTAAQLTAELPFFSPTLAGLAPPSGGGSINFLRADGNWASPAGNGTVTSVSISSAHGFGGSVTFPTSTPSIKITTSVNGLLKGDGNGVSPATDTDITGFLLTGFTPGAGTVSSADSILQAIQKLSGNAASYGPGTVTSVGLSLPNIFNITASPVVSAGVLTATFASQAQNLVFASPSGSTGTPTFRALLGADVPTFTSSLYGVVPASGGGTTNFLRADGAWAVAGVGSVTSVSVATANGFSGSVANASSTPAITLSTSVSGIVKGASGALTAATAADITGAVLTGYVSGAGTISATDTILQAIQKLNGNTGTLSPLTTKGDIWTYSTTNARQAVPNDYGNIVPDSTATNGWRNISHTQGRYAKNYIQYGDFENNSTTGWTATGCATVTNGLPVSVGSGAAPFSSTNGGRTKGANTNVPAIDSSSAISGVYALNLATTGAGVIGDGYISSAYAIDPSDRAKVLSYKLNYKVVSGTPVMAGGATNTYAVAIYDLVNNSWIIPAGAFNFVQSSGVGIAQGTFQTAPNTTSLQIFIYSPVAPTGTSSLLIDDIYLGPQSLAFGPPVLNLTPFTPVVTGFGTSPTVVGRYRRVGDTFVGKIQVDVTNTAGVSGFTIGTFLPPGLTPDTAKILKGNTNQSVGKCYWINGATGGAYAGVVTWNTAGGLLFYGDSGAQQWNSTVPAAVSTSTIVYLEYEIPITGWDCNTVMSADFDGRGVVLSATGNPNNAISTPTLVNYPTVTKDTHGSYNVNGTYTVMVAGDYDIQAATLISGATSNAGVDLAIYKNGAPVRVGAVRGNGISSTPGAVQSIIPCVPYDTIQIYVTGASGITSPSFAVNAQYHYLNIKRLPGSPIVAQSEAVIVRGVISGSSANTSFASGATEVVDFDSLSKNTHNCVFRTGSSDDPTNALRRWKFVPPSPGQYRISAFTGWASYSNITGSKLSIYKSGAFYCWLDFNTFTTQGYLKGSTSMDLLTTDDICIAAFHTDSGAAARTIESAAGYSNISIELVK